MRVFPGANVVIYRRRRSEQGDRWGTDASAFRLIQPAFNQLLQPFRTLLALLIRFQFLPPAG
ncbi:hypothetical protein C2E31_20400 [Rhodopirellula baltica]|nr:hypothetical protein C2E31_20400 [Rhodopirellula baltica]